MNRKPKFPNEDKASAWIDEKLTNELALAMDVFDFWNQFGVVSYVETWRTNKTPDAVIDAAMALNVQGFRLFKSVIRECQVCEGISAAVLARSLFETSLALWFVCKKELCLELGKSKSGDPKVEPGTTNMPAEKRAKHYQTFLKLQNEKYANKHLRAGRKEFAEKWLKDTESKDAKVNAIKELGDEWTQILNEKTYSGLNARELAKAIDPAFEDYYDLVYALQSQATHGTNALNILHEFEEGKSYALLYSQAEKVRMALFTATQMFLVSIMGLHDNLGLGTETERKLEEFSRRLNSDDIFSKR